MQEAREATKAQSRAACGVSSCQKGRGTRKPPGTEPRACVRTATPALILHEREVPVAMETGEAGAPADALARAHLLLFPSPPSVPSILIASARARLPRRRSSLPCPKASIPESRLNAARHLLGHVEMGAGSPGEGTQTRRIASTRHFCLEPLPRARPEQHSGHASPEAPVLPIFAHFVPCPCNATDMGWESCQGPTLAEGTARTPAPSPAGTKGDGDSSTFPRPSRLHPIFLSSLATELSYTAAANLWSPRPQEPLWNKSPNHLKFSSQHVLRMEGPSEAERTVGIHQPVWEPLRRSQLSKDLACTGLHTPDL